MSLQQAAFSQVAETLSSVADSKVYYINPETNQKKIDSFEYLSSNDAFSFIEEPFCTVLNITSQDLLSALPTLISSKDKKFIINAEITNLDYSIVTAFKDSGYNILISSNAKESYDFSITAYLLSKVSSKSTIHFYVPSQEKILTYSQESILSLYESFESKSEDELESAFAHLQTLAGKIYAEFELLNSAGWFSGKSFEQVFVFFGNNEAFTEELKQQSIGVVSIKVYRPFQVSKLNSLLKSISFDILQLVEQSSITLQFQPLFLDLIELLPDLAGSGKKIITSQLLKIDSSNTSQIVSTLISNSKLANPIQNLTLGKSFDSSPAVDTTIDECYLNILHQVEPNLAILNDLKLNPTPEFSYGRFLYDEAQRSKLIRLVEDRLQYYSGTLNDQLTKWLIKAKEGRETYDAAELIQTLEHFSSGPASPILRLKEYFHLKSTWIVGSDNWAFDTGLSAFHELLKSGNKRLKLLIIDSDSSVNKKQGKKNLGLYAMNYGNSYVSSVAIYSSYTQTLTSLLEANAFHQGPAIVLAYLPKAKDHLQMLKETKIAVDTGYWPLYRYNPTLENQDDSFNLDSSFIKRELQNFLDRENKLTLLASRNAKLEYNLQSYNKKVEQKIHQQSKDAFHALLDNLGGDPLTILFASDGGNAASISKKLAARATSKGLKAKLLPMDDMSLDDFQLETNVVFITSTSGQGEFPPNGKQFWDGIKNSTLDLATLKVSVFGLGDSKYWPRKEDAHYYNKPSTDLFAKLKALGAGILCDLGQGDDQDADGFNTGYNAWEPKLWESLGVSAENADEPPPITNEDMKINSNFLRGTIVEGLADKSTGAISASDQQLTKFHGIYMQDDRDLRDERKKQGLEPAYSFMARVRLPGGVSTPAQWLKIDELSDSRGNHTFKITTRATYQLHGIVKSDLKECIKGINAAVMDTLAACGDVCRNVMCSAVPHNQHLHDQLVESSKIISEHLLPNTTAYHEIWLNDLEEVKREGGPKKIRVGGDALQDSEPMYGPTYLPRKYKVVITLPPYNDVDVWAHDVGLIAIVENNNIVGYNVLVGGGMGTTHNNTKTYPRTGSMFGYAPIDKIQIVCEKIMLVQRDFGDRKNRKHARLKYTIDDMGVDVYKGKVEELQGFKFEEPRPFKIDSNIDYFGWTTDERGLNHYTCFIENGRIEDTQEKPHKIGLKKIAEYMLEHGIGEFRLTGNQHILISNIPDDHLSTIKQLLAEYKLDNLNYSQLRLSSSSCVSFPTCGLAMAEAERYLPVLVSKLEEELEKIGLRQDSVVMRMTGCPNGCARPWLAEIALVGKSYGFYNLMLGGGYKGDRVNKLYKSNVNEEDVLKILVPMFAHWATARLEGEHFGDFVIRAGYIKPTLEGKYFWDDLNDDI